MIDFDLLVRYAGGVMAYVSAGILLEPVAERIDARLLGLRRSGDDPVLRAIHVACWPAIPFFLAGEMIRAWLGRRIDGERVRRGRR